MSTNPFSLGVPPKYRVKLSDVCHTGRLPRRWRGLARQDAGQVAGQVRLAEKSDKMGSRWGRMDRRKIQQNPYKISFFKAFARREHYSGGVEFSGGYDGRRCRMSRRDPLRRWRTLDSGLGVVYPYWWKVRTGTGAVVRQVREKGFYRARANGVFSQKTACSTCMSP